MARRSPPSLLISLVTSRKKASRDSESGRLFLRGLEFRGPWGEWIIMGSHRIYAIELLSRIGSELYRGTCLLSVWCTTHQGSVTSYCSQPFLILRMVDASSFAMSICSRKNLRCSPGSHFVAIICRPHATASGPITESVAYSCRILRSNSLF